MKESRGIHPPLLVTDIPLLLLLLIMSTRHLNLTVATDLRLGNTKSPLVAALIATVAREMKTREMKKSRLSTRGRLRMLLPAVSAAVNILLDPVPVVDVPTGPTMNHLVLQTCLPLRIFTLARGIPRATKSTEQVH